MRIIGVNQKIKILLLRILIPIAGSLLGYGLGILLFITIEFLINGFGVKFLTPWPWIIIKLVLLMISLVLSLLSVLKFKLITKSELQTPQPQVYLKYSSNYLMLYFWIGLSVFFVISLVIFLL